MGVPKSAGAMFGRSLTTPRSAAAYPGIRRTKLRACWTANKATQMTNANGIATNRTTATIADAARGPAAVAACWRARKGTARG